MVQPETEYETDKSDPIYPFVKEGIFTGVEKFDQVYKPTSRSAKQFYANLPGILDDLHNFLKILTRFEFTPVEIKTKIDSKFKELAAMTV